MFEGTTDTANIHRVSSIDEAQQRHHRAVFQTSPSMISTDIDNVRRSIPDILDDIYSNRAHQRCIDISYSTLLSMTLAVIFWVTYWLTSNRCENSKDPQSSTSLCDSATVFEVFIFISIIISPILFIITVYSWIYYACYNPFDPIRKNHIELKLEGNQWKQQIDSFNTEHKIKCFHYFRRKQQIELNERGYGYIILSPHGIVLDELILLSTRRNIIHKGTIYHNEKLVRLVFKKTCTRPWEINLAIYLPENYIEQNYIDKLQKLLKIRFECNTELPHMP